MLLHIPIRLNNLATLDLNRHLVRYQDGKRDRIFLLIPGEEEKNKEAIEAELPPEIRRILDVYLSTYRAALGPADSPWLFPGHKGHKNPTHLSRQKGTRHRHPEQ